MKLWLILAVLIIAGCSGKNVQMPIGGYPVKPGEVGPVAVDNPMQFPFSCTTSEAGLGEPLIDNYEQKGYPVWDRWLFFNYKKGYSQYCGAKMEVSFYYRNDAGDFKSLAAQSDIPGDAEYLERDGRRFPFVVRYERGVINRFIYGITSLTEWPIQQAEIVPVWNKQLIMLFNGGIGIGHHQSGIVSLGMLGAEAEKSDDLISLFNPDLLARGYLLAGSTGMGTDTSFNLPLLLQTAGMVKKQVVAEFGEPDFTLGLGASGGAIQQFFSDRHSPELLDGVVVSHMFPDLLTQMTGVGDCELLQYYFDNHSDQSSEGFWKTWHHRGLVEGFNAIDGYPSKYSIDGSGVPMMSTAKPGSSVCVDGWRGITPLMFNPKLFLPFYDMHHAWLKGDASELKSTNWTHWDDAVAVYGTDQSGYALRTYDNVGVQYGLEALKQGAISVDQFLDLNARIGGWKPSSEMTFEQAPFYPFGALTLDRISLSEFIFGNIKLRSVGSFWRGTQNVLTLMPDDKVSPRFKRWFGRDDKQSIWSHQNSTASLDTAIAERSSASVTAIERAKKHGMVFGGVWDKPTIAMMVYLDDRLDIHDARQPFVFRERMRKAGHSDGSFSIWGLTPSGNPESDKKKLRDIATQSVETLSAWLQQGEKPPSAIDRCWDKNYQLLAAGESVWNGVSLNHSDKGQCAREFKIHGSPRVAAGEPFAADLLKCPLKSVSSALQDGTYATIKFSEMQKAYLEKIFKDGVCAYN